MTHRVVNVRRAVMPGIMLVVACAVLTGHGGARAQTATTERAPDLKTDAPVADAETALKLLRLVAADAATLKLPENRARLRIDTASLLWRYDEPVARRLFGDAVADIASLTPAAGDPLTNGHYAFNNLRNELLTRLTPLDPRLALDALRATRLPPDPARDALMRRQQGWADEELRIEHGLLYRIAESDPAFAFKLAEASIAKGITYDLLEAIGKIGEKDPVAGSKLREMMVESLLAGDFEDLGEANVVRELLRISRVAHAQSSAAVTSDSRASDGSRASAVVDAPLAVDRTTARRLAAKVATAALTPGNEFRLIYVVRDLMSELEGTISPGQIAELRRRINATDANNDPRGRVSARYSQLFQSSTSGEILVAAEDARVPNADRDVLIYEAARKALDSEKDPARARQIAERLSVGYPERAEMLRRADTAALQRRITGDDLADARRAINSITNPIERFSALTQLAARMKSKGESSLAGEPLAEAEILSDARPRGADALGRRLLLARLYGEIEPRRAFALTEPLVDETAELLRAAEKLDGFVDRGAVFRDGELVIRGDHYLSNALRHFDEHFVALTRLDPANAARLAGRFESTELRSQMRLIVIRQMLARAEQPTKTASYSALQFGGLQRAPRGWKSR